MAYDSSLPRSFFTELNKTSIKLKIGAFKIDLLHWGFIDKSKWWRNYLHVHTYYEICYAFSGSGTFKINNQVYQVRKGDVFVAKPHEEHEIISSHNKPLGIYFWSYTLVPCEVKHSSLSTHDPVDRLLHAFIDSKCWINSLVPGMLPTLELLTEEGHGRQAGYPGVIEGLTRKLLLDTARAVVDVKIAAESVSPRADKPARISIDLGMRYMRDNHGRNLAIRTVAAQLSMSERNFNRLFKKYTRQSPLAFLTQVRVEAASQLLLDRLLPIKEIAVQVGIPDVRYFTTVFRKAAGITPAAYRELGGTTWRDKKHMNNRAGKRGRRI